ncbi:PUB3, partial [Symbiodinium sp. KB8]
VQALVVGRAAASARPFEVSPYLPFASRLIMASSGASSADAAAWADFAAAAGLDVVAPTTSPTSPITPSPGVEDEVAGPPTSGEPEAEAPPSSGGGLDGDSAVPPISGEPALVESTPGEDDIAPPVMGVPSSSEDEEELLADPAGAPFVGALLAAVDTADVGVQTARNVIIPAFDLVDVASQTDGKLAFSSFVGDTPQSALATAIRALSPGSLFRLDGALRQALAQPLVDVAPSLQGGVASAHAPPDLDLLGDTPGEQPSSSGGVVDPGPGPASARIFWEEQNATAVAEQAAVRPLPDDDFDPPATALEAYLKDQDAAAGTTTTPSPSGLQSSASKSPGGKPPFRKAPPPALVVETPEVKVGKAPPVPYPHRQIAFLAEPPKKPPVKRAPVQPQQAPPTAEAAIAAAPAASSSAASSSGPVVAKGTAATSQTPAPEDTAFIRQEQMARSQAGMRLLHDGATYAQALESRIEREMEEQRRADDAAALATAKPKGPPAHLVGTEARPPFGGVAAASQAAPEVTPTPAAQRRTGMTGGAPEITTPAGTAYGILLPGFFVDFYRRSPLDRPGRAGYGTRNQSRRRDEPTNAWVPHTVREWAADTWADAERLEAEIAAGRAAAPGHYNLVRLVLCEVPGQLPPGWDAVPRRRWLYIARAVIYLLGRVVSEFLYFAAWALGSKARVLTMSSRRGSFAELVALAERAGESESLPALALAGVRNIAELTANTDRLVEAGISPITLEALLAAPPPVEAISDLAVVVEAVRPANVKQAVTELRDNMLAKSIRGPYESIGSVPGTAWRLRAGPITTRTLEVIGAAFRAGAYRSAKEYFLAAFRYQEHDLRLEVDPMLRRFANRVIKAIVRGLPGSRLKEAFPLPALAPLVNFADRAAFDPARAAHSADVFVIAVLREIEVAAARVGDMVVSPGLVVLDLPLHKTATGGERTLTRRSLRCACGAATHPLCPVHAAMRHLVGLEAAGLLSSARPLLAPGAKESVSLLRGALEAANLLTTYQDANGIERQVAGATFLAVEAMLQAGDAKTRHRTVGNGWHWGVASRLLGLLVWPPGPSRWLLVHRPPSAAPGHDQVAVPILVVGGWDLAPPPRPEPQLLGEGLDEESHWAAAARMQHSLVGWPTLEPALEAILEFPQYYRHDLVRIRRDVLEELREMVEDASDDTAAWLGALPDHVRATYVTKDRPRPFQGPVFDRLLRGVGYPAADDLRQDVDTGFDMLGKATRPRDQEHTRALLDELVAETRLGRVMGPCAAPDHWSVSTVALPSVADMGVLRQPPPGDCFAALSFAICQVDENGELKLRRGEDWRQSGHNATMGASDVPTHHFLGDIVDLVLRAWAEGWDPVVFGHDLQNAYRQWAVRHPGHCDTFLPSAAGVTLWFHFAMCFGAAASVWNFNRAADAVQMLLRSLLLVLLGHFVDDFNGVDAADLADSAHHAVADFFALLGLQTKPSKAQAPAKRHVVQGVELSIGPDGVELSPTAQRTEKILGQIDDALANDSLSPDGGRHAANSEDALSVGLRAALGALRRLVASHRPRLVPWPGRVNGPFPVLYADAFFLDGDLRKKPGHLAAGDAVPRAARWQNGWGYVLLLDGHVFYDYGVIKQEHLAPFAARKAFIYVLEIVAQVLPLVTFARRLSPFWIAFIDNVAGQFALMKGYGKDPSVNGILASFWGLASDRQWAPDFHRVPSESNVSDAISRGDDSRARAEGWTRVATPVDDIMDVLGRAASDIDFACHSAPERLLDLAVW